MRFDITVRQIVQLQARAGAQGVDQSGKATIGTGIVTAQQVNNTLIQ
jgi:hypothetical protein